MYRTERLRLVPIGTRHAKKLWELHQDEGIARWYPWSREEALRFAERMESSWRDHRIGKWLAYEESTGVLVGLGGPSWAVVEGTERAEIGWAFRRSVWGCGYATEIGRAGLDYAFSVLGLEEVVTSARDYKTYRAEVPHCSEQGRCWAFGIEKGRLTC